MTFSHESVGFSLRASLQQAGEPVWTVFDVSPTLADGDVARGQEIGCSQVAPDLAATDYLRGGTIFGELIYCGIVKLWICDSI